MAEGTLEPISSARVIACTEIDSTNSEAVRRAQAGEIGPLWIVAEAQTRGRGRSGRQWSSPAGNLYATLLFRPECEPAQVHQLSLLAGVALHEAIQAIGQVDGLRLKWPNDVLVGQAKLAGVLSESIVGRNSEPLAMLGIGVNLSSSPHAEERSTTHLAAHGVTIGPRAMLTALDTSIARWLTVWNGGRDFAKVRSAWLARAGQKGERLMVNTGAGPVEGYFADIDSDGSLLLADLRGCTQRFTYGDVTVLSQTTGA